MQAQMQAIFESKTRSFPEFGKTDQNVFGSMLKSNYQLILGRGTVENFSKNLFSRELQLFVYKF